MPTIYNLMGHCPIVYCMFSNLIGHQIKDKLLTYHDLHASYRMRKEITLIPCIKQICEWTEGLVWCFSFHPQDLLCTGNQRYFLPHSIRSVFLLGLS